MHVCSTEPCTGVRSHLLPQTGLRLLRVVHGVKPSVFFGNVKLNKRKRACHQLAIIFYRPTNCQFNQSIVEYPKCTVCNPRRYNNFWRQCSRRIHVQTEADSFVATVRHTQINVVRRRGNVFYGNRNLDCRRERFIGSLQPSQNQLGRAIFPMNHQMFLAIAFNNLDDRKKSASWLVAFRLPRRRNYTVVTEHEYQNQFKPCKQNNTHVPGLRMFITQHKTDDGKRAFHQP